MIDYKLNKGYSSTVLNTLLKNGYKTVKKGAVHCLIDPEGLEATSGATWYQYLQNVEILMR